ncbi:hypothetical protein BGW42_007049, partial [Actinomortierella wolfii]
EGDVTFVEGAVRVVVDRVHRELRKIRREKIHHMAANKATHDNIEALLLSDFLDNYAKDTVVLMQLLKLLTYESNTIRIPNRDPKNIRAVIAALLVFVTSQRYTTIKGSTNRTPLTMAQLPQSLCFQLNIPTSILATSFDRMYRLSGSSISTIPITPIDPPPITKTETRPLQIIKIDQSTIEGDLEIMETIVGMIGLSKIYVHDDNVNIVIAGDQLTVARLQSLKAQRAYDIDRYDTFEWAHPTIQMFHLQMSLCASIFATHYGSVNNPGSLAAVATMLGRHRMNDPKIKFRVMEELLYHTFDAIVLLLWESLRQDGASEETEVLRVADALGDILSGHSSPSLNGSLCNTLGCDALKLLCGVSVYKELDSCIKADDIGHGAWQTYCSQSP